MYQTLRKSLVAAAVAVGLTSSAMADTFVIDSRHTFPAFELVHFGYSLQRGRFNKTSGKIELDQAAKKGSLEVTIDAASIDTGLEDLAKHLKNEDFFDVAKYPTITFKSSAFKFNGDKVVGVDGDFTLHGVTKPLSLTVDHFHCANHPMMKKMVCGANAVGTIKRSEFGMAKYVPALADEVKLIINVEAIKE